MEDTVVNINNLLLEKQTLTISERGAKYYAIGQVVICIVLIGLIIAGVVWYANE